MPITIVDDDVNGRPAFTITDDDTRRAIMAIKAISEGGTGTNMSATGPGLIKQESAGANFSVQSIAIGELVYGTTGGAPAALAANNTTTRKFLMERAAVTDTPVPTWDVIAASDITSGVLPVARGGLGASLAFSGPGVVTQDTVGGALTVTRVPALSTLTLQRHASLDLPPTASLRGQESDSVFVAIGNENESHTWYMITTVGAGGALAPFRLYNTDTGTDAISVSTTNNVTLCGLTAARTLSASGRNMHTLASPARVSTDGTDATPVTTEFYFAEVFVPVNVSLTGVAIFNGSAASGNMKVGLFNSSGTLVATSASTAMSGTDAYQRVAFTGTYTAVGPATYYIGLFIDNNTARFNTHTIGNGGTGKSTGQTYATGFTAITPPTTFTTAIGPMASLY